MKRLTLLAGVLALAAAPASAATMIPVPGTTAGTAAGTPAAEAPAPETSAADAGIGHECAADAASLRATTDAAPHTLRLTFDRAGSAPDGAVETRLTDAKGAEVLSVACDGPALLVDLPDGHYKLSARLGDKTVKRNVTIAGGRLWTQVIAF